MMACSLGNDGFATAGAGVAFSSFVTGTIAGVVATTRSGCTKGAAGFVEPGSRAATFCGVDAGPATVFKVPGNVVSRWFALNRWKATRATTRIATKPIKTVHVECSFLSGGDSTGRSFNG